MACARGARVERSPGTGRERKRERGGEGGPGQSPGQGAKARRVKGHGHALNSAENAHMSVCMPRGRLF